MATVVGLFDTRDRAQAAIEQLRSSGLIEPDKISVVMRSREETQELVTDTGVGSGAVTGAIGGGVLGGLAGLLVGIGALAIPGIGPIIAGGWLASTLVGAGIGAATGGLVGALVDAGVPEEEAKMYHTGVERGGVLVAVQAPQGQESYVRDVLNKNGARDIKNDYGSLYTNPDFQYGTAGTTTTSGTHDNKTNEIVGGAGGAVAGGVIGAAVGGPVGAAVGAGIGGAGGAVAADAAEGDDDAVGAGTGGAGGAVAGGLVGGAIGGPIGAAAGAAVGAGAGAGAGEAAEEEIKEGTTYNPDYPNTTRTDTTTNIP